jgi:hypothetical protein
MRKWLLGLLSGGALVAIVAICLQRYWLEVRGIWINFRYPILENQPVIWEVPKLNALADEIDRPNIILILADDLGFNDISLFGGGFFDGTISTPNIDSIGHHGVSFYQGYAGEITSHTSMFTHLLL